MANVVVSYIRSSRLSPPLVQLVHRKIRLLLRQMYGSVRIATQILHRPCLFLHAYPSGRKSHRAFPLQWTLRSSSQDLQQDPWESIQLLWMVLQWSRTSRLILLLLVMASYFLLLSTLPPNRLRPSQLDPIWEDITWREWRLSATLLMCVAHLVYFIPFISYSLFFPFF